MERVFYRLVLPRFESVREAREILLKEIKEDPDIEEAIGELIDDTEREV